MASVVGRLGRQRRYGLSYVAGFIALIYQVGLRPWDFLVRTKRFDVQEMFLYPFWPPHLTDRVYDCAGWPSKLLANGTFLLRSLQLAM